MVNQRIVKEGFRRGLFSGKVDKGGWGWAEEGTIELKIRGKRGESQGWGVFLILTYLVMFGIKQS